MVSGEQDFVRLQDLPERGIASVARRRLGTQLGVRRDGDDQRDEFDLQRLRDPAALLAPARRIRMELMVDVRGAHAVVRAIGDGARQRMQQDGGIEPAAERDAQLGASPGNQAFYAGKQC